MFGAFFPYKIVHCLATIINITTITTKNCYHQNKNNHNKIIANITETT